MPLNQYKYRPEGRVARLATLANPSIQPHTGGNLTGLKIGRANAQMKADIGPMSKEGFFVQEKKPFERGALLQVHPDTVSKRKTLGMGEFFHLRAAAGPPGFQAIRGRSAEIKGKLLLHLNRTLDRIYKRNTIEAKAFWSKKKRRKKRGF